MGGSKSLIFPISSRLKLEIDDVNEVGSFKIKCQSCSKSIWYKLKDANESIINDIVTKCRILQAIDSSILN